MAIKRFKDIIDAFDKGQTRYTTYRKVPTQSTNQGVWFDLSMSPGNPSPQYYAATPMLWLPLKQSTDWWVFHWWDVSPLKKYLHKTTLYCTSVVMVWPLILADYLYFYPFIDEGITDEQFVDNTNPLTRSVDGSWVQIMAVSVAWRAWWARFQVKYTNQDWIEWRLTTIHITNNIASNWNIITTQQTGATNWNRTSPFLTLQEWDTGVRKIESVTMLDPDVWLFALVLVKPIVTTCFMWTDAPVEVEYFRDKSLLPEIEPDAFLNFISLPSWSALWFSVIADFTFIFN